MLYAFAEYPSRGGFNRPAQSEQREAARPRTAAARREGESEQAAICRDIARDPGDDDRHDTLTRQFFYEQVQKAWPHWVPWPPRPEWRDPHQHLPITQGFLRI